jgi:hypothetical protein
MFEGFTVEVIGSKDSGLVLVVTTDSAGGGLDEGVFLSDSEGRGIGNGDFYGLGTVGGIDTDFITGVKINLLNYGIDRIEHRLKCNRIKDDLNWVCGRDFALAPNGLNKGIIRAGLK